MSNSPASFQRFINEVFKKHIDDGTLVINIDDVIILAENEEQGLERLAVGRTAEMYGLQINWKKSKFLENEIAYRVSHNKIAPSSDKIQAVLRFPMPTTVNKVQSFLGT